MSTQEIRKEIHKVVDNMPEDVLQNILDYFKTIEHSSKDTVKLTYNLKKILTEDKLLLQKLAL
jgi:hypothetical protein